MSVGGDGRIASDLASVQIPAHMEVAKYAVECVVAAAAVGRCVEVLRSPVLDR